MKRPSLSSKSIVSVSALAFSALQLGALVGCSPTAPGNGSTGGTTASGGAVSSGGTNSSSGGAGLGGATSGGTMSSGGATSGGASTSGGSNNTGGSVAGTSSGGAAGSSSGGASTGGSSSGGAGSGSGGSAGSSGAGGGGVACPANATFCSGFEETGLPKGAVYKLNGDPATPWTKAFELDTTVHHSGSAALRVRSMTEDSATGAYKMLAVPAPGSAFWVRFYLRSDVDLGANDHNVYAYAAGSDDPNSSAFVEFAEDVGLAFNSHDDVRWPTGFGRLTGGGTMPFSLPKDTWYCIELSFDGQNRVQQLYVDGMQKIDATMYPAMTSTFTTFKFGYNALHGTVRTTWYDDVAVAPARINCL